MLLKRSIDMNDEEAIYTLHRYLIWSNLMRERFQQTLEIQGPPPKSESAVSPHWLIRPYAFFCYWFASLYVVIEGWRELGLKDHKIDALLSSNYVGLLRRLRNGVFHFQKDYFDSRFRNYTNVGDPAANWADDLHNEFSRYFLEWYESRGIEYSLEKLENGKIQIVITKKHDEQKQ